MERYNLEHRMRMVDDIKMKAKVHSHPSYTSDGLAMGTVVITCIATRSIAVVINLGDLYSNREMTINYNSLAEKATKLGIWMEASGGNRYAILSALDPPHEGVLVNVGSERYTIIDEDDLVLLSLNKYRFDGRYVSSSNSTLHRDIMERHVEVDWTIRSFIVIHLYGDQFDNRRSNLRWIDRRVELDYRTMLPRDIKKQGRKYRVRISIDGRTRFRTYKNKKDAMDWWLDTRIKMMYDAWPRVMDVSIIMHLNGMSDE